MYLAFCVLPLVDAWKFLRICNKLGLLPDKPNIFSNPFLLAPGSERYLTASLMINATSSAP